ncbi:hypothetical protein JCM5350_001784 [Sporobolomyces pararoseus]
MHLQRPISTSASTLSILLSLVCLFCSQRVKANTEIINFEFPQHLDDLPAGIEPNPQRLILLNEPIEFTLPISHRSEDSSDQALFEFTYEFDPMSSPVRKRLEHWQKKTFGIRAKRTARLSWPASHPMDFKLDLYAIPILKSRSTLQFGGYLLITYRSTSVHSSTTSEMIREVPVTVVIEPCWVGGIPESLLGTLGLVIILAGGLVVFRIPQKITEMLRGLRDLQKNDKED